MTRFFTPFFLTGVALFTGCATDSSVVARAPASATASDLAFTADAANYDIASVDVRPKATHQTPPRYPLALRKAGVTGYAIVDFIVDTTGHVRRAFAIRSTNPMLAEAAVAAVEDWQFKPGLVKGRPVNTHMQVPIQFQLSD